MSSNPPEVLLAQLKQLGQKHNDALFAAGGSVTIDKPVRIHYTTRDTTGATASNGVVTLPPDSDDAMDQLIAACEPSGFGKGKELVHDETYRSAFELPSDRLLSSFQLAEHDIMSEIHRLLAPNAASVRAKPYKLNVYKQGGFFKAHVDTPRGGNMFGTLVVCLPSSFSGGEFEVKHNGQEHVFAWGSDDSEKLEEKQDHVKTEEEKAKDATAPETPSFAVRWCAFYSDCSHEVLEVKSGYRVTLTFLLENNDQVSRQVTGAITQNPFVVKLAELLKTTKYSGKGKRLGFALEHKYVVDNAGTVPMLKGFDRFVKEALDALGLKYKFVPVFIASPEDFETGDDALRERLVGREGPGGFDIDGFEVYVSSWRNFGSSGGCDDEDMGNSEFADEIIGAEPVGRVRWVVPPKEMPLTVHAASYGNEPSSVEYYATAAFLAST